MVSDTWSGRHDLDEAMNVIINADDLGISVHVNDEIFRLMQSGKITSATMLANGPAVEAAAKRVGEFPHCSFGVHLNVTEFKPVSGAPKLAEVLSSEGAFQPDNYIRKRPVSPGLVEGIAEEWIAQVQRVKDLGVPISHLDSHHHMHTHPPLMCALAKVQQKFEIRKVRLSQNIYTNAELAGRKFHHQKKWIWQTMLRVRNKAITTDKFTKFSTFIEMLPLLHLNYKSLELMVHPGHSDPIFQQEIVDLETDWQAKCKVLIKLVSYHDL